MNALAELARRLADRLGPDRVLRDEPIGPMTTYRVGGAAAVFCEPTDEGELVVVAEELRAARAGGLDPEVLVIGRGSNLLVADTGFPGLVVRLGAGFATIGIEGVLVRVGAAASLPTVARRTAAEGLTGFEWAVGVPGSIGGAVRMNAGGHGSDMAASLRSARVLDLATASLAVVDASDLGLGYRASALAPDQVVTGAVLELEPGDRVAATDEIAAIVRWRRENQPGGQNAGSVFVNPPGDAAGRLIEAAGCKGLRIGSAEVSDKHANFIQVDPAGRAADVAALMATVADRVLRDSGIRLRAETRLVGFDAETDTTEHEEDT